MESAPPNALVRSARDLKKQKKQNKHDGVRFVFFFAQGSFCLALVLLRLCVQELSQLISPVLLSW